VLSVNGKFILRTGSSYYSVTCVICFKVWSLCYQELLVLNLILVLKRLRSPISNASAELIKTRRFLVKSLPGASETIVNKTNILSIRTHSLLY
jgi:hypothetical protein